VGQLEKFNDGELVDFKFLEKIGFMMRKDSLLKILGNGKLTKKLTVAANFFSESAVKKIEDAGGTVEIINTAKGAKEVK
jgi:large subunit ribosomal protein L15